MPLKGAWRDDIQTVVADLEHLNRATEADFLAVGGKLMEFHTASRALHDHIAALSALVSGEQAQDACDSLLSVRQYAERMRTRSEKSGRALQLLQTAANRIRHGFSGFGRIAVSFRITAILARMEAAHLSSSSHGNLKNLADDVRSCSDGIRTRAEKVLDAIAAFHSRLGSALPAVARFEAIQRDELPALLAAVGADVELFQERRHQTARISAGLSASLEAVGLDIGGVASALQFQDITRQQIEHVIEALNDPSCGAALVRLQKAQLESGAAAFLHSTREIDSDLESISTRIREMAAAGKGVDSTGGEARQDSFLADMQRRLAAVSKAVSELEALERATLGIVGDLALTRDGLRTALAEVQSIETQLSHIAINAVISATHIGADGGALKVIADAIRQIRTDSATRSGDAANAVDGISDALAEIAETGSGLDRIPDLAESAARLESAMAEASRAAAQVASASESLCADLQNARRHLGISRLFADTITRCCQSLDRIAEQAPADGAGSLAALRNALQSRYTMESERNVHRNETGSGSAEAVPEAVEVEFF